MIIVYLTSDFALDAVDSAAPLQNYYTNIKLIACALKEPFQHLAGTLVEGLMHHLTIVSIKFLDFLGCSIFNVSPDSFKMPFVAPLDPIKSHAFKDLDLLKFNQSVQFFAGLIDNLVEHLPNDEESNDILAKFQLVFIFLSGILIFSVQLPLLKFELVLDHLVQNVLFVIFNDALMLFMSFLLNCVSPAKGILVIEWCKGHILRNNLLSWINFEQHFGILSTLPFISKVLNLLLHAILFVAVLHDHLDLQQQPIPLFRQGTLANNKFKGRLLVTSLILLLFQLFQEFFFLREFILNFRLVSFKLWIKFYVDAL